jgi:pimeloyl-[acyl-carrier protein] methyl ester esterase
MGVNVRGARPDLVLLHGWGMNHTVWTELAALLADGVRVHCIDLNSLTSRATPCTLAALVDAVALSVQRATVCGWSLGGQVALRWARQMPAQVERVILIATTPRFVRGPDWDFGMEPAVFDAFASGLDENIEATLRRFVLLQAHGDNAAHEVRRRLRACVNAGDDQNVTALAAGLRILQDTDLRSELASIRQPTLILHGERDCVVPTGAGEYLLRALPHAELEILAGAGHAPFLSAPHQVARRISRFCHG